MRMTRRDGTLSVVTETGRQNERAEMIEFNKLALERMLAYIDAPRS